MVCFLVGAGHPPTAIPSYGLSFFFTAIETLKEQIKTIAYGVRLGMYAEDIDAIFEQQTDVINF